MGAPPADSPFWAEVQQVLAAALTAVAAAAYASPSQADAFRGFAYGVQGGGPISIPAAMQGFEPSQADYIGEPALPGGREASSVPYAPLDSDVNDRVRSQATHLLNAIRMRSSMVASDPHWPYRFWRDL